jgi:hypothetical protein
MPFKINTFLDHFATSHPQAKLEILPLRQAKDTSFHILIYHVTDR